MNNTKKIAITGDKGFIGTHLKKALENKYGNQDVDIQLVDIKDGKDILNTAIENADIIYHLAAQTSVLDSMVDPMYDAMTNIAGTIKILKENPNAKIILAASIASIDPQSAYGISKLAQEQYARVLHDNIVVCRFSNIFSKDDHGVVGLFINKPTITIYGDGKQTRDFVHVEDIAEGLVQASEWPTGEYDMGSGVSHRIIDIARITGKEITFEDKRDGEIVNSVSKNTTPDWKPKTDILEYVREMI